MLVKNLSQSRSHYIDKWFMHLVEEEDEVISLQNVTFKLQCGSVRPADEYFVFLDALCNSKQAFGNVQFASNIGLARATLTGAALGSVISVHFLWMALHFGTLFSNDWSWIVTTWCLYIISLCIYHIAEFLLTARFNSSVTTWKSFLFDQSRAYQVAVVASWIEFWLESCLFFGFKTTFFYRGISSLGFFMMVVGQAFRSGAMISTTSNFSHLIQLKKSENHRLVSTGLYNYFRHPSYCGWFWWCVGTQVLLGSPICLIGYIITAFRFFERRISVEEAALMKFFPTEYPAYRDRTWTGIPFIS